MILNCLYNLSQSNNALTKSVWIGHPGVYPKNDAEKLEIEKVLRSYNCVPVFID